MRDAPVADVVASSFEQAEAIHRRTATPSKRFIETLKILCFHSWWNESSQKGFVKKYMDIYFNISNRHFQVIIQDVKDIFTISHVNGRQGQPLEAFDLFIGAKLNLLGKTVILKQVMASKVKRIGSFLMYFCLGESGDHIVARNERKEALKDQGMYTRVRRSNFIYQNATTQGQLEAELLKYDDAFVREHSKSWTRPSANNHVSLRQLHTWITTLKDKLAEYRPKVAQQIMTGEFKKNKKIGSQRG